MHHLLSDGAFVGGGWRSSDADEALAMRRGDELVHLAQEGEVLPAALLGGRRPEPGLPLDAAVEVVEDGGRVLVGRTRGARTLQVLRVVRRQLRMELRRPNDHRWGDVGEAVGIFEDDGDEAVALLVRSAVLEDRDHDVGAVDRIGEARLGEHVLEERLVGGGIPKEPIRRVEHARDPDQLRQTLVAREVLLGDQDPVAADLQVVDEVMPRILGLVVLMELHHEVVEAFVLLLEDEDFVHVSLASRCGKFRKKYQKKLILSILGVFLVFTTDFCSCNMFRI